MVSRLIGSTNPNPGAGYIPNEFMDDAFSRSYYPDDACKLGLFLLLNLDCGRGEIISSFAELKRHTGIRSPINALKMLVKRGFFTVTQIPNKHIAIRYTKPASADFVPPALPPLKIFEETRE
jgi:hypothetical protein